MYTVSLLTITVAGPVWPWSVTTICWIPSFGRDVGDDAGAC